MHAMQIANAKLLTNNRNNMPIDHIETIIDYYNISKWFCHIPQYLIKGMQLTKFY